MPSVKMRRCIISIRQVMEGTAAQGVRFAQGDSDESDDSDDSEEIDRGLGAGIPFGEWL